MSRSRMIAAIGSLAALAPQPVLAAALKASASSWTMAMSLSAAAIAATGAAALVASPAVRRLLVPPPAESHLSDVLQFHELDEDGRSIRTKDGRLVQTVLLHGLDYGGRSAADIAAQVAKRQAWLMGLAEAEASVTILSIRERVSFEASADYDSPFLQAVHDRWSADFQAVYVNRHYVVATERDDKPGQKRLAETVKTLVETLHDYRPEILEVGSGDHSPLLSFWSHMVNGFSHSLGPARDRLSERLCVSHLHFGRESGLIEYEQGLRKLYGYALCVRLWGDSDSGELLQSLLSLPGRVQVCHLLRGYRKERAQALLPLRRRQSLVLFQNSLRAAEFEAAETLVNADQDALLEHQMTVFLHADTIEELLALETAAARVLREFNIRPIHGMAATEWLWRCRLPGFDTMVRPRSLLARNLASLLSFGEEPAGSERSNWGEGAVRMFRTITKGAYALQLHVSEEPEAVAHTITFGGSGRGKTVLWQHLIGGALRHRNLAAYAFDRLQGMRVFTEAAGGEYINPIDGDHVTLNPLQCADTEENRAFLHLWLRQLAEADDDEAHAGATRALDAIFGIRKAADRSLNSVYDSAFDHGSDLKRGLERWIGSHGIAKWFNGARDSLNLDCSRLVVFEMSAVFTDPRAAAAMVSYIMHRIRATCRRHASPHLVFVDETAPMLEDTVFAKHLQELFREHRKLRGSVNVVFQDVGALLKHAIAETVLNQCPTRFVFQNPDARKEDYSVLDLTESQWAFVKGQHRAAQALPYAVLVKRGHEAVILDVSLAPLGPYLKAYRSGSEAVNLMRQLKQQFGEERWLGEYLDFA